MVKTPIYKPCLWPFGKGFTSPGIGDENDHNNYLPVLGFDPPSATSHDQTKIPSHDHQKSSPAKGSSPRKTWRKNGRSSRDSITVSYTPWNLTASKFAPENEWLKNYFPIRMAYFQGRIVSFRDGSRVGKSGLARSKWSNVCLLLFLPDNPWWFSGKWLYLYIYIYTYILYILSLKGFER